MNPRSESSRSPRAISTLTATPLSPPAEVLHDPDEFRSSRSGKTLTPKASIHLENPKANVANTQENDAIRLNMCTPRGTSASIQQWKLIRSHGHKSESPPPSRVQGQGEPRRFI